MTVPRTPHGGRLRTLLALAAVAAFAVFSAWLKSELRADLKTAAGPPAGAPAPALELPDRAGETVDLADVEEGSRLVVVAFWASWCAPCRVELHRLSQLYDRRRDDGLAVLAVSLDEDSAAVDDYLARSPLPFPVLLDPRREAAARYGVRALPTTVLIGDGGRVLRTVEGFVSYLPTQIDYLLSETAAGDD